MMWITSSILATAMASPTRTWRAVARLAELEPRPPNHDLLAEANEDVEHIAQAHLLGPAAIEGQGIDRERTLQRREPIELIEHHLAAGVALELDHDPHAGAVAFVAQVGDALDALFAHQLGDPLRPSPPCSPDRVSR